MINFIDPHSEEFKIIESVANKHSCMMCEKPLKETGVYFSYIDLNKEKNEMVLYRVGCKHCKTLYTMDFKILSIDFEKFPNFNIVEVASA